jgi:peptidoglycan/xylan/chitin deacetylase (PgdA/CDA1 family)
MFERQMDILARDFKVVRLCDLPKAMAEDATDNNIACVTFDDGYRDNYERALPVLESRGIKATFFIATGFLGKSFPTSVGECPMMTTSQVRELANLGHEVGAHTVNHFKLSKLPSEEACAEISNSKSYLEDLVQGPVVSFAYPKGDYDEAVKNLVGSLGFQIAVTVRNGLVGNNPDWLELPRVTISNTLDLGAFRAKVSPAMTLYSRLRGFR